MGMTDKVVGTGMLSFITLGGKDSPVDPKEPAQEQLDGRREQPPSHSCSTCCGTTHSFSLQLARPPPSHLPAFQQ